MAAIAKFHRLGCLDMRSVSHNSGEIISLACKLPASQLIVTESLLCTCLGFLFVQISSPFSFWLHAVTSLHAELL